MDLREYLELLKKTGYNVVSIDGLLAVVYPADPQNTPDIPGTEPLPPPPEPPEPVGVARPPAMFASFVEARKAAQKGEVSVYDNKSKCFINVKG